MFYTLLDSYCKAQARQVAIYATCYTQDEYAGYADNESCTTIAVGLNGLDGIVVGVDKHCFYNQQVVVERDDCIEQCDEYENIESTVYSRSKYEELAEETCKWGNTCQ